MMSFEAVQGREKESSTPSIGLKNNPKNKNKKYNRYSRCHVIAHALGGSDKDRNNIVPCLTVVNNGPMKRYESAARRAVQEAAGKSNVDYRVEVKYRGRSPRPDRFRMTTSIDGEVVSDECIYNDYNRTVTDGYYC
jgi:hypothetical protein